LYSSVPNCTENFFDILALQASILSWKSASSRAYSGALGGIERCLAANSHILDPKSSPNDSVIDPVDEAHFAPSTEVLFYPVDLVC